MEGQDYRVVDLRVESLPSPLGVDCPRPRFSWRVESSRRGARQSAFRVCAATTRDKLNSPDVWDSGKKESDTTLDIIYGGVPLASRQKVWWKIESWDEAGRVAECESWWEMGLLSPSDWTAKWIAIEADTDRQDREFEPRWVWGNEARHAATRKFRRTFTLADDADAIFMIGGRDRLDGLWIDGERHAVLRPADIDFVAPPLTEIRLKLSSGSHTVAAEVSFNPNLVFPSATGRFLSIVRLTYGDGRTERLGTPAGWKTALDVSEGWINPGYDDLDWKSVEDLPEQISTPWPARPAIHARRDFRVGPGLRQARLYAAAFGAYEASINGERIDDAMLAPGYIDPRATAPYRVFDVGNALVQGENAIGVWVGDGWFASACAPMSRFPFGNAPRRLLIQLELLYEDGRQELVTSGEGWMLSESAIISSEIYQGEYYDARLERDGWNKPGMSQAGWFPARLGLAPPAQLRSDITPPVRVIEVRDAISARKLDEHLILYDFGQNHAGVPEVRIKAPSGTKLTLRFAELLKDGRIDQSNLRAAAATDTYICRGGASGETYRPHFTFHGYRYVEASISSPDVQLKLLSCVVHSDIPQIGRFESVDTTLNGIWRNAYWSQRSNFVGVPTDCPQRDERLGWTGDAMVFWDAATLNMDVENFTRRYLGEVRIGQQKDGAFPVFAPSPWRAPEGMGPTPGWADAGIILPWTTWRRFGGTAIIDENWEAMTRYLECIRLANPEMRWLRKRGADFGDWLSVDATIRGEATTPKDLIATALWAADCSMMAEMSLATGRDEEAMAYREMRGEIVREYRAAYVNGDGTIGNGSQASYILSIYFDLLDEGQRQRAGSLLADSIRSRGTMLTTGFLGTPFALHALADTGNPELAFELLRRTDYPSWGYMLKMGATTMWERWNSDTGGIQMNSYNHYAFGAVSSFLMRRVVGIDSATPGFKRILMRPLPNVQIERVSGSIASSVGMITTQQAIVDGRYSLNLLIPANSSAELHLVGSSPTESGRPLEECDHVRVVERRHGLSVLEVQSGAYEFLSTLDSH